MIVHSRINSLLCTAVAMIAISPVAANADPVTWNVNAMFEDGGVLTGSFVYDADAPTIALRFTESLLTISGGDTAEFPPSTFTINLPRTLTVETDRTLIIIESDGPSFSELTIDFQNTGTPVLSNGGGCFVASAFDWDEYNGVSRRRLDPNLAIPGRLWSDPILLTDPICRTPPFPPDVEALPDLLGLYGLVILPGLPTDMTAPYPPETIEQAMLGDGIRGMNTLTDWYHEASLGRFGFNGTVLPWLPLPQPRTYYLDTNGNNWRQFMWDTLVVADTVVDWTLYDNDGPDGIPNSGDDDGYVDMVLFPTPFAEVNEVNCPPERIGPVHGDQALDFVSGTGGQMRYLGPPFNSAPFTTRQTGANGVPILVESFAINNETFCPTVDETTIGDMKSVIHEIGHAIGLSDLYDLDGSSFGVGTWDNMGLAWVGPEGRPVLFGAWDRTALGWATVTTVITSGDHVLEPVSTTGAILRIDIPNTLEWLLLENRQLIGADENLEGTGLLVWHIDAEIGRQNGWQTPSSDESRPAVAVVQADGQNELALGIDPGDAGDPFPGSAQNHHFDDCTMPSTISNTGVRSGVEITMIEEVGQTVRFTVNIRDQTVMGIPSVQRLPDASAGQNYMAKLAVANGGCPFTWSAIGNWPTGWSLDTNGIVTGSPASIGSVSLGIRVTDGFGHVAEGVALVNVLTDIVASMVRLEAMSDVNGNNKTDLGVLLRDADTGKNKLYVMDGGSGNNISTVSFGQQLAMGFTTVPDATGDLIPEAAVLVEGSLFARVKNVVNATLIGKANFNADYDPVAFLSIGEAGGGVGPDLAVVGRDPSTSNVRAQIKDAANGTPVNTISFSKDYIPFGAVAVDNVGDSAAMEIAVLGINANGQVRAQVKDALTGNQVAVINFNKAFTPLAFAAVPNRGGKLKHLAVLGRNEAGMVQVQIKRVGNGTLVNNVRFSKSFDPRALISFADSNGSGGGEIAVVGVNDAGKVRAQVKEMTDGSPVSVMNFSARYPPGDAIATNGVAGTGRNEIAVLGKSISGQHRLQIKDLLTGNLVKNIPVQ